VSKHFDEDTERYLIGCALQLNAKDILTNCDVRWFGNGRLKTIFEAMSRIDTAGHEISSVSVLAELRKTEQLEPAGGLDYLMDLQGDVFTFTNIPYAIERLGELYKLRRFQTACEDAAAELMERPNKLPHFIKSIEEIIAIETKPVSHEPLTMSDVVKRYLEKAEADTEEKNSDVIETGFKLLDDIVELLPKELTTLAARPSMGKSALALQVAVNSAKNKKRVLFVSLETPLDGVAKRIFSMETEIPGDLLKKRQLNAHQWQQLYAAREALDELPFHFVEAGEFSVEMLRKIVRYLKMKYGDLSLIVIDYVQLMSGSRKSENRTFEVSEITRSLKVLAMDEDVAILALSQLSRAVEQRQDKRPMLSDLRESGSIEQDSNNVLFLYRHEYYNPDDSDSRMQADVIVAKNRDGAIGTAKLGWRNHITKFTNLYTAALNSNAAG
jgi:replicative DNA helicase